MTPALPAPAAAVLRGDRRALAQLISRVEDRDPRAEPSLRALYPRTGHAVVVGLTGPLGVGKSSLINALLRHLRGQGKRVGVVAVDPSSPFSGGSVLGDRIRLERTPGDEGVFVRSMANRGHTGGVAAATRAVARLLDAFGMDVVLVETVGSGQADVEIREIASTSVVVLVPHLGDEVQTLKAGLFEIADVFVVNKSDLPGGELAARDLSELVATGPSPDGWRASVVSASAQAGTGIEEIWTAVEAHERFLDDAGRRVQAERRRASAELLELLHERLERRLTEDLEEDGALSGLVDEVVARRLPPEDAADRLLSGLRSGRPNRR